MGQRILKKIHSDLLRQNIDEIILDIFGNPTYHRDPNRCKKQYSNTTYKFTCFKLIKLCHPVIDDESEYLRIKQWEKLIDRS